MNAPAPGREEFALTSRSPEETEQIGATLGPCLAVGDLVSLVGPLGAGKTRFVAGLARGVGYQARVRSPTFTLLNQYDAEPVLHHADLYRLENGGLDDLGLEDALREGVLVVEWGDRLPGSWLTDVLWIEFVIVDENTRRLSVTARGPRSSKLLDSWRSHG